MFPVWTRPSLKYRMKYLRCITSCEQLLLFANAGLSCIAPGQLSKPVNDLWPPEVAPPQEVTKGRSERLLSNHRWFRVPHLLLFSPSKYAEITKLSVFVWAKMWFLGTRGVCDAVPPARSRNTEIVGRCWELFCFCCLRRVKFTQR